MGFLLTPPHRVHALNPADGFTAPPLDGSLTVPEILDFHYENSPNHPVFCYNNMDGGLTTLRYSEVVPATHRAAQYVASLLNVNLDADPTMFPTVAILASCDTVTYATTVLGLLRAGIPTFILSPRCSASTASALLSRSQTSHIFISQDPSIRDLAENAVAHSRTTHPHTDPPKICSMPTYDQIYVRGVPFVPLPPRKPNFSMTRLILHSSGSTSLPKLISWNDRAYLQGAMPPQFGSHDFCGEVWACHGIAMFHTAAWAITSWMLTTGFVMAIFAPATPATISTPEAVFQGLRQSSPCWGFAVPSFIEQWSNDDAKVTVLKQLTGLIHGGAPLNTHTGDALTKKGVKLYNCYGATEIGTVATVFPEHPGLDWEYMYLNPHIAAEFIPLGDGTYELIVIRRPTQELPIVNAKFGDEDAYATSDIVAPHPTKAGFWKVVGRLDDQITLSTGEKTNPGPLESILCQDHRVNAAVMYGRGRFQNGVIIEPKKAYSFDPSDENKLVEFRNQIWPKVEEMNAVAPTHSRLFKEMLLVTVPSKPFKYTPKGNPQRAQILVDYESEIEGVYNAVEEMMQIEPPSDWSPDNSMRFVSAVVNSVLILKRTVNEFEDIFDAGCDSLQATWIRNSIVHALRKTPGVSLSSISSTFVYEHPTIASLAQYTATVTGAGPVATAASSHRAEDMTAYLARFTTSFPKHAIRSRDKDVILVTGTTGALGSATLATLVATDSVGKIFAFNRPSRRSVGIVERQKEALKVRGYDPKIAISPKVTLVEGELTGSGLGVDAAIEEEIRTTITHIIHIAWRVDFNLSLPSFENSIGGVRTLVNLALSSPKPDPPRLQFTSSIAVFRNAKSRTPLKEVPVEDPTIPLGQGYGESKWIAEMILYAAAKCSPLRPTVVRVGQISGGVNGGWNTSDWVPSIIKSSIALGCLPEYRGVVSWIPLHVVAAALVEMRNEYTPTVNLVHPVPVKCNYLFQIISQELSLPLVPYAEWEAKLEEAAAKAANLSDPTSAAKFAGEVPAATILEFFKNGLSSERETISTGDEEREIMGVPKLETEEACKGSEALRNARRLDSEDVRSWLRHWKSVGFLP